MNTLYFKNADELKRAFSLDDKIYTDYTPLNDVAVGFSVQRKYPANIAFKPPKFKDNADAVIAVFWVVYNDPHYKQAPNNLNRVPLKIRISAFDKYINIRGPLDYDFTDENCPTEKSVLISQSTPHPLELEFRGRYFFNHSTRQIEDARKSPIPGANILDDLFARHCKTISQFNVQKRELKKNVIPILDLIIKCIAILLYPLGRKIKENYPGASSLGYKVEIIQQPEIDIFGYKASKNVVFTFCLIIILAYFIYEFFKIKSPFIYNMVSNNLLSLCISIVLLGVLDFIAPKFLLWLINLLEEAKTKLTYHKVTI